MIVTETRSNTNPKSNESKELSNQKEAEEVFQG